MADGVAGTDAGVAVDIPLTLFPPLPSLDVVLKGVRVRDDRHDVAVLERGGLPADPAAGAVGVERRPLRGPRVLVEPGARGHASRRTFFRDTVNLNQSRHLPLWCTRPLRPGLSAGPPRAQGTVLACPRTNIRWSTCSPTSLPAIRPRADAARGAHRASGRNRTSRRKSRTRREDGRQGGCFSSVPAAALYCTPRSLSPLLDRASVCMSACLIGGGGSGGASSEAAGREGQGDGGGGRAHRRGGRGRRTRQGGGAVVRETRRVPSPPLLPACPHTL